MRRLDGESVQRSVLRGDCYFCWLGQYDKCEANCNNKRAIPRYGNHDITPSGKFQLRSQAGSETHDEWLTNQANKTTLRSSIGGIASSDNARDRSASIGVGGQAGRLSRFEILQENKRNWALRHPLLSTEPPKLSSLSGRGAALTPLEYEEITTGKSLTKFDTYGGEIGNGVVRSRTPTAHHLEVRSCRLPMQPEIPHKHGARSVKVQVTPYSFAEVSQRSALLAHERHHHSNKDRNPNNTTANTSTHTHIGGNYRVATSSNSWTDDAYVDAQRDLLRDERGVAARARSPSLASTAVSTAVRHRSPSVSVTHGGARRSSSAISVVRRGNDGVVKVTRGGGPNTPIGGPSIQVKADDTSSYILTAKLRSALDMPLPELFQNL